MNLVNLRDIIQKINNNTIGSEAMRGVLDFVMSQKALIKKIVPTRVRWFFKSLMIRIMSKGYKPAPVDATTFAEMPKGVNLIGDIRMEIGLGQSMRLLANQLEQSHYDFGIYNLSMAEGIRRSDRSWDHRIMDDTPYGINLFHINPQELGMAYLNLGGDFWKNKYNIGFWLWELEDFPKEHMLAMNFVDEIWTPSEFTSNCFRNVTDKPVYTIPYHVTAETDPRYNRANFGLPEDKFLYLIMFDLNSTMLRKNPEGAIEAFKKAFSPDDQSVGLVVKVNNPTEECMDTLRQLLRGYENVYYITDILSKPEVNGLIGSVDVFVSLHRAEGFGLVMAEAMLLKTACIATNWSSNTEFMNSDVACMVSYDKVKIRKGEGSYPSGAIWADPSIEETSQFMKRLKEDPQFYERMVDDAYAYVSDVLSKDRVVSLLEDRLAQIYAALEK